MMRRRRLSVALVALASTACFHQVVQTGRPAGTTVIDKPWVSTWIFGLIPGQPIETRPMCPSGVAIVTTETSFMNGLVGLITIGIYTPQHVTITCATGGTASLPRGASEIRVPANATANERVELVNRAVEQAAETNAPVVLRF